MSDLIERLRAHASLHKSVLTAEAAEEISLLRAEAAHNKATTQAIQYALLGEEISEFMLSFGTVREVAELVAKIERLRADEGRLDWIADECGGEGRLVWQYRHGERLLVSSLDAVTLRAAIDAAMGGKE